MKMKMITTILMFILSTCIASSEPHTVYSAGIKLGGIFGKQGGFLIGFEFTYGKLNDNSNLTFQGAVAGLDFVKGKLKLNFGLEYQYWPVPGVCIGPTGIFEKDSTYGGLAFSIYDGFGFLNAGYTYNFMFDRKDLHEMDFTIKIPYIKPGLDFWTVY